MVSILDFESSGLSLALGETGWSVSARFGGRDWLNFYVKWLMKPFFKRLFGFYILYMCMSMYLCAFVRERGCMCSWQPAGALDLLKLELTGSWESLYLVPRTESGPTKELNHLSNAKNFGDVCGVCGRVCAPVNFACRSQRCGIPRELELRATLRNLMWMLEIKLVSSGRAIQALHYWAISPGSFLNILNWPVLWFGWFVNLLSPSIGYLFFMGLATK